MHNLDNATIIRFALSACKEHSVPFSHKTLYKDNTRKVKMGQRSSERLLYFRGPLEVGTSTLYSIRIKFFAGLNTYQCLIPWEENCKVVHLVDYQMNSPKIARSKRSKLCQATKKGHYFHCHDLLIVLETYKYQFKINAFSLYVHQSVWL